MEINTGRCSLKFGFLSKIFRIFNFYFFKKIFSNKNPTVSVIVSCYNHEKFILEALEGVLSQIYTPLEIVIIDDCSTDTTALIIENRLQKVEPNRNVRFIKNKKNIGTFENSALGLKETSGNFVVIVCGDDILMPEMISEVVKAWQENNVSMVITNAIYIDDKSNELGKFYIEPTAEFNDSFEALARDGVNACCFGPCMSFERVVYDTFGWPPKHLEAIDIMAPFYAYLLKGAIFLKKPLFKYRVHTTNTSHSLLAAKGGQLEKLKMIKHIYYLHLAHSVYMQEVIFSIRRNKPIKYFWLARKISPLLKIQNFEMSKKLINATIDYEKFKSSHLNHDSQEK